MIERVSPGEHRSEELDHLAAARDAAPAMLPCAKDLNQTAAQWLTDPLVTSA